MAYQFGYFLFLSLMSFQLACNGLVIESADSAKVVLNRTSDGIYNAYMNENNHDFKPNSKTPILKITGGDPKIGTTGAMFLYVLEKSTDGSFILYSTQSFDYELNQRFYTFIVKDGSTEETATLNIINIDDEPPSLTSPQCSFPEKQLFTKDTSTCKAKVSDPDGWLDQMTFRIINSDSDGNEDEFFSLEFREQPADTVYEADVYMVVKKTLLYEKKTFYLFNVAAKDGAGHPTTPDPLVKATVTVIDTRGNPPVWTNFISNTDYTEQTVAEYKVHARDGDSGINAPVFYEKISEQEEGYISIDEKTGIITVNKIDRDKNDISTYEFDIIAYVDPPSRIWNTSMKIVLHVQDIDNNPPIIRNSTVNATIIHEFDEGEEKVVDLKFIENYGGNLNTSTLIRDIDTGENAEFTVQLLDLDDAKIKYTEAFFVAPNAGYKIENFELAVRNSKPLDYEDPDWRYIKFYVFTQGLKDKAKQDRLLINISLIDYNDEWPIFNPTEYEVKINETANSGTFVAQIMATDRDAEDKILNHTLKGSSFATSVLRIESDTGKIYINGDNELDYDKVNPIFVQVIATDKVGHMASASLTIDLLDVNNKAPSITSTDLIEVEENQITGIRLNSSIKASDPDTTAKLTAEIDWEKSYATKNSRKITNETQIPLTRFLDVKYEISKEDHDYPNRKINIYLEVSDRNPTETTPDYELFDSLFLAITVIDWNTDPEFMDKRSTSETLLISIIDINDNIPYFPDSEINKIRNVQEIQSVGTPAGMITAIDLDVNDIITYNCTATDKDYDWFEVNKKTGEFTVKTAMSCDYPKPVWNVSYVCNAFDGLHLSDPATINFTILDYNNKIPTVDIKLEEDKLVHILEKSDPNKEVVKLNKIDLDRDEPFHTVVCEHKDPTSECSQEFYIKDMVVYVRRGGNYINRDKGPDRYECTLSCRDNPNYADGGVSNAVVPDPVFTIKLDDKNDNTPSLELNGKSVKCYENITANSHIEDLLAIDIDEEGPNNEIHFDLKSAINLDDKKDDQDLFALKYVVSKDSDWWVDKTHKKAHLVAVKDLKDHYGRYNITILLSDRGTPQLSQDQWFVLEVQKFNFEPPRFVFPVENQKFRLKKIQEPKKQLILQKKGQGLSNFTVTDNKDSEHCRKWGFLITINAVDSDFFTLDNHDPCNTQLQVKNTFQSEYKTDYDYKIKLTARIMDKTDGEKPMKNEQPYETTVHITVTFTNNIAEPIFKTNSWTFKFFEKKKTESIELKYTADYEDSDDEDNGLYYYISTEDNRIKDLFSIDEKTGKVSLKQELDYETDETIKFKIVASNAQNKDSSYDSRSYLDVTVEVIGINYYTPEWTKSKFYGVIMKGYQKEFPVAEATATDRDKIDKDRLTYEIFGEFGKHGNGLEKIPSSPFLIDSNTGKILLNFVADGSMDGYIDFNVRVSDKPDGYGHGPHHNETKVAIFFITMEYLVKFKFLNTKEELLDKEQKMLEIISDTVSYNAFRQDIEVSNDTSSDGLGNLTTYADLFFINEKGSSIEVVERSEISRILSNWDTYVTLARTIKNETGLQLVGFQSTTTSSDNLEEALKAALIAVTVVLGLSCLVLLILFIVKVRQLNKRISKLVNKKFGSEESGLNRLGVGLPNSNKHAVEGSNPIFSITDTIKDKEMYDYDRKSVSSGDSDLVGVENNPEFDYSFSNGKKSN